MPTFFDPKNLSSVHAARWSTACDEYVEVMRDNAARAFSRLNSTQRNKLLATYPSGCTVSPENFLKSRAYPLGTMAPGDRKSALFARLLDGGTALPYPPPTYFSYPWYAVIENDGPFEVMLGGIVGPSSILFRDLSPTELGAINIGQTLWTIWSANDAARRLVELDARVKAGQPPSSMASHVGPDEVLGWHSDLFREVLEAYEQRPQFMVSFGEWPQYRLELGQGTSNAPRYHAEAMRQRERAGDSRQRVQSVFDLLGIHLNVEIGETLALAVDPRKLLQSANDVLEKAREEGKSTFFAEHALASTVRSHEERLRRNSIRADLDDMVEVKSARWVLSKIGQSPPLER